MIDDQLVKKAYTKVNYTLEQIEELRKCLDPETGPMYFLSNFIWLQHPTRGKIKFEPYQYQIDLLGLFNRTDSHTVVCCARQLGKTTVVAGYLLWYAMFVSDRLILVASKSGSDAKEIMQRVRFAYESIPDHIRAGVKTYNKQSIEFDNDSRIISTTTTENTGRGMSLSLVYLDEFAFVDNRVAVDLWTSLSPTLSTGGKCIITSTPNSVDDQFAQIWFKAHQRTDSYGNAREIGANGFIPFSATWKAHPDRDEAWAESERNKIGEDRFRREHCCEFVTFEETLIDNIKLNELSGVEPLYKVGQIRWYEPVDPGAIYVLGLDPSLGTGGDYAAIQLLNLSTMAQAAEWQHNRTNIEDQLKILKGIGDYLVKEKKVPEDNLYWSVESNTIGEAALAVIRETGEEFWPGTMLHDTSHKGTRRKGFVTTNKNKLETCAKLKNLVEKDKIKLKSIPLLSELRSFVSRGESFSARSGSSDDLVMGLILTLRMAQVIAHWEPTVGNNASSNLLSGESNDEPMPLMIF